MMRPGLRPTRISKHAAEFAGKTAKSMARKAAQQTGGAASRAQMIAKETAKALEKAPTEAKKAGHTASKGAPTWNGDISKFTGNAGNGGTSGAHGGTSQAETWMAVEQMVFISTGSSGSGQSGQSGQGSSAPAFTTADQAAVIEAIKAAVKFAVDMWKMSAHFSDLKIMAISAIGTPGCLDGPQLESHIRSHAKIQSLSGAARDMANGIAEAFSDSFFLWQDAVTVPGLPWYPAFAAYPGPAAPPMPNIPMPLASCVSSRATKLTLASELSDAITQALPAPLSSETDFINRVAAGLALAASTWLPSAQVMNVLGFGPVPTFAPPYVPVGPVMNGTNIAAPGHLATAPQFNPMIF
ncbi:hypothetical protein [Roseibium sediminicola]|uniref:Uncharacterized protein n=1 Tax=Roseibium sediminicola TaxID=2933272 RepID=A0ABT0H2E2_9HYPH|nr:hypothetical protein [Roseibium sp. CAU 1639]MCK7615863.1 hypothetical protein [Roseibium sp. CAU 1639]